MSAAPAIAEEVFEEHRIAMADGVRVYVRDYPAAAPVTGLPVFCLPGLTRNSRDFSLVAPRIAALGRRVIAWDTRGRGQSDRDPDPSHYEAGTYVGDALAVLGALGIERCVFVGTSMGGIITMVLATVAPQKIAGAVLNDIGPQIDPTGLARIASYVGKTGAVTSWESAAAAQKLVNEAAFPDADEAFWARFAQNTYHRRADGGFEPDYDPAIANAFAAPGAGGPPPDLSPLFAALAAAAPVLVVRGGISDLLSAEGVAHMRTLDPDLAVVEVPRVGHAPTMEDEASWPAIIDFLAGLP